MSLVLLRTYVLFSFATCAVIHFQNQMAMRAPNIGDSRECCSEFDDGRELVTPSYVIGCDL